LRFAETQILNPIDSPRLSELAKDKKNIVLIASDHTRPVPSKIIVPALLDEIRLLNPDADITILIATGCHRGMTDDELLEKFGKDIYENEKIVMHDCDTSPVTNIGMLPSGSLCYINSFILNADLVVSEGFIEPHFFAGFSGGRKSVMPGCAKRSTVMANHCYEFINSDKASTGNLIDNPINIDMEWTAQKAGLAFILNVVLNDKKEIVHAVAGHCISAHRKGCDFLSSLCQVEPIISDIVITSNSGYPLDRNIYQAVKGMTAAEASVKPGRVIIMVAKSQDGHGADVFYEQLAMERDVDKTLQLFSQRKKDETEPDQWQSQIFIRVLKKAHVIYVSDVPDEIIEKMHMIPAKDIDKALEIAKKLLSRDDAKITVIPDGVGIIVKEK